MSHGHLNKIQSLIILQMIALNLFGTSERSLVLSLTITKIEYPYITSDYAEANSLHASYFQFYFMFRDKTKLLVNNF